MRTGSTPSARHRAMMGRHHARHLLGDDVARGQVGQRMGAGHHRPACGIDEDRALAAHRLADQRLLAGGSVGEPQRGRVELDELEVGDDRACPQRQGHAVAGRNRWVCRRCEDLPHAAGGQYHRRGADGTDAVVGSLAKHVQGQPRHRAVRVGEQVEDEGVLNHVHAVVGPQCGDQCPLDFEAGGVARVRHSAA
jgi:hypothetical protein